MQLLFGIFLIMMVGQSLALGVSDIELNSFLNQKLDAHIQLKTESNSELDSLTINISPVQADGISTQALQHEILKTDTGNFLKITTSDVVKEPVLSFQLEINGQKGHLVREYTLLIDPPGK